LSRWAFLNRLLDDDLHVLTERKALQGAVGGDTPTVLHHFILLVVRPLLVVVKEAETTDTRIEGETQCVRIDRMAPLPGQTVFLWTVFGVVDEEIRTLGKGGIVFVFEAARMPVG
jgi:hypothetical protein